jgi:hypothetical protein
MKKRKEKEIQWLRLVPNERAMISYGSMDPVTSNKLFTTF